MRVQAQGMRLEQYLADDRHRPRAVQRRAQATPPRRASRSTWRCGPSPRPRASSAPTRTSTRSSRAWPPGSGEPIEEVRERFERAGQVSAVRSDIKKRKALEWLLERAEVLDPDGEAIDRSELEPPADEDDDDDDDDDESCAERRRRGGAARCVTTSSSRRRRSRTRTSSSPTRRVSRSRVTSTRASCAIASSSSARRSTTRSPT